MLGCFFFLLNPLASTWYQSQKGGFTTLNKIPVPNCVVAANLLQAVGPDVASLCPALRSVGAWRRTKRSTKWSGVVDGAKSGAKR